MKKRLTIFIICLIITAVLVVPFSAKATPWGDVKNAVNNLGVTIVNHAMGAMVGLAGWFAEISGGLLNWVISPDFVSFSYTRPGTDIAQGDNPIIEVGLNITKNFVNLGLVIALIFIAISVSLQIGEYGSKKTFIKLVVVAILVNFVPVICGLIVDAANITMNFFLQGIRGEISGALTDINHESLTGALTRPGTLKPFTLLVKGAIMMGLYFSIGLAFLLMTFIFVFRYIAIWLLVILGPLAFVAWILPSTKRLWDMWWKQLFQWSFIGVPMAFFLYLAARAIPRIKIAFESKVTIPGADASVVSLVDQTFPYLIITVLIYMGFFIGLKATAFGSSTAIRAAQWAGAKTRLTKIPQLAGRGAKWGAKEGAKKVGRGLKPVVEGRARKLAAGAYSRMIKAGDWSPTKGGRFKPGALLKWVAPKKLKEFGNLRPVIDKGMAEAKGQSGMTIGDELANEKIKGAEATGWYSQLLAQNDSQDLFEAFKRKSGKGARGKKWKNMSDDEITSDKDFQRIMAPLLIHASNSGKLGSTLRRDPRIAEVAYEKDIGSYGKSKPNMSSPQDAVNKAVTEARDHLKDWEPESLKSQKVAGGVMAHLDRDRQLQVNRQIKNGQDTQLKTMDNMFSDFVRENKDSLFDNLDLDENEIAGLLSDTISGEESEDHKKAWEEFDKHIENKFGDRKYFVSVEDERFKKTGWRKMKYVPKDDSDDSSSGSTPPPSSPGSAPGVAGPLGFGPPPRPRGAYKTPPPKGPKGASKRSSQKIPKGARKR